jgi:hypothetical protein
MVYPRPLTPQEETKFLKDFPNGAVGNVSVLGPSSDKYNCLAWSLNILNAWVWPWPKGAVSQANFDTLYRSKGFTVAGGPVKKAGDVAAYGISTNDMTHGACVYGGNWTSKLGAWLLVSHTLPDLTGPKSLYGFVNRYYQHPVLDAAVLTTAAPATEKAVELDPLSEDEMARLSRKVRAVPGDVVEEFDRRYNAWRATWFDDSNVMFSDPESRTRSDEFEDLIILGPEIVPLLVNKLQYPDEFFAMMALEIFLDPELVYRPDVDHPDVLKGEQGRARTTLKRWLISG